MTLPRVDVHQHLWDPIFVDALRRRSRPPRLDAWDLHLSGEPVYRVAPAAHDAESRRVANERAGCDRAFVALSSPLGIEDLPAAESRPLLDAYHAGIATLPGHFFGWAATCVSEPDPGHVRELLAGPWVGLQLPATSFGSPGQYERLRALLDEVAWSGKPLFIHPGPAAGDSGHPGWWAPVVDYVGQMHAAYHLWLSCAARDFPDLPVVFAMLAGLAPLHSERASARGGPAPSSAQLHFETSSYGPRAVAAITEAIGADRILAGSDAPYAAAATLPAPLDAAAWQINADRLFGHALSGAS